MIWDGKPKGFFHIDHRTVDWRYAIITYTHVTLANVHESIPYLVRLGRQPDRFGFDVRAVDLGAGYASAPIAKGLEKRDIRGATGYVHPLGPKGMLPKPAFPYGCSIGCLPLPRRACHPLCYDGARRIPALQVRRCQVPGLPAVSVQHFKCSGAENRHPPCLGRCPCVGGRPSHDRLRQPALCAAKGNRRAVLRTLLADSAWQNRLPAKGHQTAFRPTLRLLPIPRKSPDPSPPRRHRSEYQGDRDGNLDRLVSNGLIMLRPSHSETKPRQK